MPALNGGQRAVQPVSASATSATSPDPPAPAGRHGGTRPVGAPWRPGAAGGPAAGQQVPASTADGEAAQQSDPIRPHRSRAKLASDSAGPARCRRRGLPASTSVRGRRRRGERERAPATTSHAAGVSARAARPRPARRGGRRGDEVKLIFSAVTGAGAGQAAAGREPAAAVAASAAVGGAASVRRASRRGRAPRPSETGPATTRRPLRPRW